MIIKIIEEIKFYLKIISLILLSPILLQGIVFIAIIVIPKTNGAPKMLLNFIRFGELILIGIEYIMIQYYWFSDDGHIIVLWCGLLFLSTISLMFFDLIEKMSTRHGEINRD